jgi:PhnB protein
LRIEYLLIAFYRVMPGVAQLIDFLKEAFDAEEIQRMALPDGTISYAEVRIGEVAILL